MYHYDMHNYDEELGEELDINGDIFYCFRFSKRGFERVMLESISEWLRLKQDYEYIEKAAEGSQIYNLVNFDKMNDMLDSLISGTVKYADDILKLHGIEVESKSILERAKTAAESGYESYNVEFMNGHKGYKVFSGLYKLEEPFNVNIKEWINDKANAEYFIIGVSVNEDDEQCTVCYFSPGSDLPSMNALAESLRTTAPWVYRAFECPYKVKGWIGIFGGESTPDKYIVKKPEEKINYKEEIKVNGINAKHMKDDIYKLEQPLRIDIHRWIWGSRNQNMCAIITDISNDKRECSIEYLELSGDTYREYVEELNKSVYEDKYTYIGCLHEDENRKLPASFWSQDEIEVTLEGVKEED